MSPGLVGNVVEGVDQKFVFCFDEVVFLDGEGAELVD